MGRAGIGATTLVLWLILAPNFGLLFCQKDTSFVDIGNLNPQTADTTRLGELFVSLEEVISLEKTADSDSWRNVLRNEILHAADHPQALEFIVERAGSLGVANRNRFRMKEAEFWHKLEFDAASRGKLTKRMVQALNNLGLIYRRTDKYEAAIEAYQQAIVLAESTGEARGIVFALNGLGNIFLELGNLDEAMLNFRECLRQEQALNNLTGIAINLNNIGHVYREWGDLERAMEYFMLSLEVNQEIPSQRGIAICYNDIGEIYRIRGENDKALSYFELSLNLNKLIGDLYYLGINHLKIAEIYFERKDFDGIQAHLDEAIRLSELTNNRSNLMKSYRIKYETEHARGHISGAIKYLEKAWTLNDSILNENMQRKVMQMQATFNRERSNSQIALLQNEKMLAELRFKRQKDYTLVVVAGLFVMVIGLGLLAYLLLTKNRAVQALKMKNREVEQARLQLAEYNQQLLTAKQEAELNNKLKSQFLANMSHEIRTPLNSVIGFADLLSEKITDSVKLSYLESIRSSGRSLLLLIEDILDLSKIEAGKLKPELHSMSLNNLFLELRRIFELQAFQKNILLKFETSSDFPEIIVMHEGSLRQIMVNLVGNALKFTESGQIIVSAEVLQRKGENYDLKISVSDTGSGIAKEDLAHIFDAFYQSQANPGHQKGTGLGLTITKRLVELLNGTITATSVVGEGTTFEMVFREVKTIAFRTAFRLARNDRQSSPLAMLTNDNTLLVPIDKILAELGLTCDLYEEITEFRNHISNPSCRVALWDAEITDPQLTAIGEPDAGECVHILLTKKNIPDYSDYTNGTLRNAIIKFPDELPALKALIKQAVFGSNIKEAEVESFVTISDDLNPDESALLAAYNKATQSQIVQDVVDFANRLAEFGEKYNEKPFVKLGHDLERTARAIDIEMMNSLMDEFSRKLKSRHENPTGAEQLKHG